MLNVDFSKNATNSDEKINARKIQGFIVRFVKHTSRNMMANINIYAKCNRRKVNAGTIL